MTMVLNVDTVKEDGKAKFELRELRCLGLTHAWFKYYYKTHTM